MYSPIWTFSPGSIPKPELVWWGDNEQKADPRALSNTGIGPFFAKLCLNFICYWLASNRGRGAPWDSQTIEFAEADFSLFTEACAYIVYGNFFFFKRNIAFTCRCTFSYWGLFKNKLEVFLDGHVTHIWLLLNYSIPFKYWMSHCAKLFFNWSCNSLVNIVVFWKGRFNGCKLG